MASPGLEVTTGDGISFFLSVPSVLTGQSTEIAREGDRQLELLFNAVGGEEVFGRLLLAEGDSLDDVLTGGTFGAASLSVWDLESAVSSVPLPAGLPLAMSGLVILGVAARRKKASP